MSSWIAQATADDDTLIEELSDRVRHDAYEVDPDAVARAVLLEVADSWEAFTQGRAHGHGGSVPRVRRPST
jgi:hypothetical protein